MIGAEKGVASTMRLIWLQVNLQHRVDRLFLFAESFAEPIHRLHSGLYFKRVIVSTVSSRSGVKREAICRKVVSSVPKAGNAQERLDVY